MDKLSALLLDAVVTEVIRRGGAVVNFGSGAAMTDADGGKPAIGRLAE